MTNDSLVLPKDILPWQSALFQQLWQSKQQNRLAHALLFIGMDGLGKRQFAQAFAEAIMCTQPSAYGVGCEQCHACHMLKANTHPDLMNIEPEEEGKVIGVDQIRAVVKSVNETTLAGGYRIIIISPAAAMNTNAANALLKTLEEPAPKTLLILISREGVRLPATIVSRCQKVIFSRPNYNAALDWLKQQMVDNKIDPALLLKLANGAPLKALAWLEKDLLKLREELYQSFHALSSGKLDPLKLAAQCLDMDHLGVVDLLISWMTDLLRYKLTSDPTKLTNTDHKDEIMRISIGLLQVNLLAYLDQLQQTRTDLVRAINVNKQLMLENLFIRWAHYVPS